MNTTRMLEIAAELGALYQSRAGAALTEWQAGQDMERRKVELTPTGDDWKKLASSDDGRKVALEQICQADEAHQQAWADHRTAHGALLTVQGQIEALEAERRALEWQARAALVEALRDGGVQSNHRGDPAGDQVFDNTADHVIDQQSWPQDYQQPGTQASFDLPPIATDNIPF
jgi:hypothetical protein